MKTLYLDCGMGAAGDMITAALVELLPNPDKFIEDINSLEIPKVKFIREKTVKKGIQGTNIHLKVNGEEEDEHHHSHDFGHGHHHHRSMHDIENIVKDNSCFSSELKEDILAVYRLIAEAEGQVHGVSVNQIHFHEVGQLDAIADILAACMLMKQLNPEEVIVSPVCVGYGQIQCAHGILPVPAPATANILKGVPIYAGDVEGELCTPTGAAILKHFATRFEHMPMMKVSAIGYGMGKRDFGRVNCVRAFLGERVE